jgi:hypothetical protein
MLFYIEWRLCPRSGNDIRVLDHLLGGFCSVDNDARGHVIPNPHHPAVFRIPQSLHTNEEESANRPL